MTHKVGRRIQERVPDALLDNTRQRATRANRRLGYGAGVWARALIAAGHALLHVTVPLRKGNLYSEASSTYARKVADRIFGKAPAWIVLERGRNSVLHLHAVTAQDARGMLDLPPGACVQEVEPGTEECVLQYLCKPGDARACKRRDPQTGKWVKPTEAEMCAAVQDYLRARREARRRGKRLPRLSWTRNVPRLVPDRSAKSDEESCREGEKYIVQDSFAGRLGNLKHGGH